MVILNYSTMEMVAKIVYYGPGLGGKTTNLQTIHNRTAAESRGQMVSLATETDRTLFFDLLPLDVGMIGGFRAKFQLYTVPGQVFYNTTRKLVLKGVDGLVFVADSQVPMMDANRESFQNLRDNLAELNLTVHDRPIVLQYNKRDIPKVLSIEQLERTLNPDGFPYVEASAINGIGVFETLREISKLTLTQILNRNLGKEPQTPKPSARRPVPPEPEIMPEANFDEAAPSRKQRTPIAARDSFEQTLDNLDLDLSDDDDAFMEEDSLEMEDFDAWDEEDSLDSSQEAIGEDTSPGDEAADEDAVDDSDAMPTLDFGSLRSSGDNGLDDLLEADEESLLAAVDEDASLERQVDAALSGGPTHELDFMTDSPWEAPDEIELGDDLEFPDGLELEGDTDYEEAADLSFDGDTDYSEAADLSLDGDTDFDLADSVELDMDHGDAPKSARESDYDFDRADNSELGMDHGDLPKPAMDEDELAYEPMLDRQDSELPQALEVDDPFNLAGPSLDLETDMDEIDNQLDELEDSLAGLDDSAPDFDSSMEAYEPAQATGFALVGDSSETEDADDNYHQAYDFSSYGDEESLDLPLSALQGDAPPALEEHALAEDAPDPSLGIGTYDDDLEMDAYLASGDLEDEEVLTSADLEGDLGLDFDVEVSLDSADLDEPAPTTIAEAPVVAAVAAVIPEPPPVQAPKPPAAKTAAPLPPRPVSALDFGDLRKKPKVSSGLDELKRLTTRIQTSKLPRLKDAELGGLMGDPLLDKDKKAKPDKFTVKLPTSFEKAQINCVFVDEDGNVVHTELFEVNARKLEDGKYQVRVVIDAELEE